MRNLFKKALAFGLTASLSLSCFISSLAVSAESISGTVTVSDASVTVGTTSFDVNVNIKSSDSSKAIYAAILNLSVDGLDGAKLEDVKITWPDGASTSDNASNLINPDVTKADNGSFILEAVNSTGFSDSGDQITATFSIPANATPGSYAISANIEKYKVDAASYDEEPFDFSAVNGTLNVNEVETECDHANATYQYSLVNGSCITKLVCPDCDYSSLLAEVSGIKFSHSLNLQSDISINYVVTKNSVESYGTALKAVFERTSANTGAVVTTTITDYETYAGGSSYWNFQFQGIAACELLDDVTASLYATVDGVDILLCTEQYNVLNYIDNQLAKASPNKELCKLLMNLVRYSADAQIHFNYAKNTLVSEKYTQYINTYVTEEDRTDFVSSKATYGSVAFSTGLNLANKVSANIVFKHATYTGSTENLTLKLSYYDTAKKATVSVEAPYSELSDLGYGSAYKGLQLAIPAAQFSAIITAELLNNGESTGNYYTYSIETYAANKYTGDGSSLSNLVLTMMAYADSANAYFTR